MTADPAVIVPIDVAGQGLLPEEITDHVAGLLADLGATPGAIGRRLAALGITGHRDESDRCPIANYLRRVNPSLHAVNVLDGVIEIRTEAGTELTVPASDEVSEFVSLFDQNYFPRLDASAQPNPAADPGTTARQEARS
ncbi:hypothetical protein [Actinoplanes subtropicus]|uniref:hypothetical protein n=1 Tax=Actinoplanes subtropicus TaxID=543632 RepID=UPI0004C3C7FC|nr:hypothetical protein [Actinoplanes subtropicus]